MSTRATSLPTESILPPSLVSGSPDWKSELNAKLAEHRLRRAGDLSQPAARRAHADDGSGSSATARAMATSVAARVAERYANAPSYSEVLATQAAAAAEAAETAVFAAQQAHEAAQALLSSLDRQSQDAFAAQAFAETALHVDASPMPSEWSEQSPAPVHTFLDTADVYEAPGGGESAHLLDRHSFYDTPVFQASATVEHHEPLPERMGPPPREVARRATGIVDAFAEAIVTPAMNLPTKLIEFPRELIATRKSRPRIAEGPLYEEDAEPSLRIFEVGEGSEVGGAGEALPHRAEQMAYATGDSSGRDPLHHGAGSSYEQQAAGPYGRSAPARPMPSKSSSSGRGGARSASDTTWQSIRLGEHPSSAPAAPDESLTLNHRRHEELPAQAPLQIASLGDRSMAALVDITIVGAATLVFVLVFAACTAHPPSGKSAFICGALVLGGLFLLYEWLFMSYGGGTPGMRYAHIALCTFDDENPTRRMMRSRVGATTLSALALGLGFAWALFDEDQLGWHDRMTRTYQRSYR